MPTWTTIGLSVLAGVLLCLGFLYALLRWTLHRFLRDIAAVAGAHPLRITARPMLDRDSWYNEKAVTQARAFFETQGYRWTQDFAVEEIEQLYMSSLLHKDGSAAVIYDHPELKSWIDLVALKSGRDHLTVSSSRLADKFESPEYCQKIVLENTEAPTLLQVFRDRQAQIPKGQLRPLTAENFRSELEEAYAAEIDWRNARGGPSREEIKKSLMASQQSHNESEIESIWELQKQMAMVNLEAGLSLRFMANLSAEEKLRCREDNVVAICDLSPLERLIEILSEHICDEEYEATALPSPLDKLPRREAFLKLQELIPEPVRFKHLGSVDFPVDADFYLSPQGAIPVEIFPHRRIPDEDQED